jgi:hypothetical protein
MSGQKRVILSAIQKKGASNSTLASALDNANVESIKLEKEKEEAKKK